MGQCCGFVKNTNDAGVITHQAQFSREIEEHLDKLEKERIEVQETCSQIGNGVNQGSIIGQYDGKDISHHQSNLSNEIQKQRSVDRNVIKKESAYEDYEVKIVEASPQRDSALRSYSLAVDKSNFSPVDSHRELERTRSQEKSPSFVAVRKQESLSSHPIVVQDIHFEAQDNNNQGNDNSNNNSLLGSFRKSNSKDAKDKDELILKSSSLKHNDNNEQIFFPGLQSQTNPINNNSNNAPPAMSPGKKDSSKSLFLQTSLPTNQYPSTIPLTPVQNQSTAGKEMAEQYQQSGGRKSILTNTLTKKDDPNSGSKSLLTHDDQIEKKKDKKVKLIATPDKRFDTDIGVSSEQLDVHTPTKPKGVLKKYDPNASYSDADSPHNKPKKKVKFKESTFKKNSKKKKM